MPARLPALCLSLVAATAHAEQAVDARACSRHAARSGEIALAAVGQAPAAPRASSGLRLSVGPSFPL